MKTLDFLKGMGAGMVVGAALGMVMTPDKRSGKKRLSKMIPAKLAGEITAELKIPTIGIGAGQQTDGQVLVLQDMLGITRQFKPRYLRTYGTFGEDIANAIRHYISDVKSGDFPNEKEQY